MNFQNLVDVIAEIQNNMEGLPMRNFDNLLIDDIDSVPHLKLWVESFLHELQGLSKNDANFHSGKDIEEFIKNEHRLFVG